VIFKSAYTLKDNVKDIYDIFYNDNKYIKTNFINKNLLGNDIQIKKIYNNCVSNSFNLINGGHYYNNYYNNDNDCNKKDDIYIKSLDIIGYKLYVNNTNILLNNILKENNIYNIILQNLNFNKTNEILMLNNEELKLDKNIYASYNIKKSIENITFNENDITIIKAIYETSIDPNYHAILWKLLSSIISLTKYNDNFVYIKSGNSLAYREYNIV
jgi:hypothetical protein